MRVRQLWNTLRYLRPEQVVAQLRQRLEARFERVAGFAARPRQAFPGLAWLPAGDWLPPGAGRNSAEALSRGEFTFLNRAELLGCPPRSWQPESAALLWNYNLHYFEWLWALPFEQGAGVARDWIDKHELARGRRGWDPYPTSLRLENWCAYFFARHREATLADSELRDLLWHSIRQQADWLAAHLEHHLLGNHLLENAAALCFVGACFEGESAATWRRAGDDLLGAELAEQLLADGGHFERSPLYLARVVWLLQALDWTADAALRARVAEPLARARTALADLCHPDGEIALLNDSAFGIANAPGTLSLPEPQPGPFALAETGYFGARSAAGHYLVCDAAPIGPDYIPGHAHGDLLSFELTFAGQRVFVDAGVFDYEISEVRRYARSTAAHNTIEIDGADQCEFWGAFRVARRGRPRDVQHHVAANGFRLEAWHDGYTRLPGAPRHHRTFRWHERGVLLVRDEVDGATPVTARSRLHLHPSCAVELRGEHNARVTYPGGSCLVAFDGPGELSVEASRYFPEFGVAHETQALCLTSCGSAIRSGFCIADGADALRYDLAAGADVDGARCDF